VLPQVDAGWVPHRTSGSPAEVKRQRPTEPVWLHDRHGPLHATLQQVPSEQWPEAQSPSLLQAKPFSFMPQLRWAHCCPAAHWALLVQLPSHRLVVGSHEYGAQGRLMPPAHAPLPSQIFTPDSPSPSQMPVLQMVSATYRRQAPLPSQVPSCPQVAGVAALQVLESLGVAPAATKVQSPSALGRLHALQVPSQAEVQQTPSTQCPVRHSLSHWQDSLLPLLGEPASSAQAAWIGASARQSELDCPLSTTQASRPPPSTTSPRPLDGLQEPVRKAAATMNSTSPRDCGA
jgi:hypothetical protein